jgi:hypothetical protein
MVEETMEQLKVSWALQVAGSSTGRNVRVWCIFANNFLLAAFTEWVAEEYPDIFGDYLFVAGTSTTQASLLDDLQLLNPQEVISDTSTFGPDLIARFPESMREYLPSGFSGANGTAGARYPHRYAAYAYDATVAMILAVHDAVESGALNQNGAPDGYAVSDFLRNRTIADAYTAVWNPNRFKIPST